MHCTLHETDRFCGLAFIVIGAICLVTSVLFSAVDHLPVWGILFGLLAAIFLANGITLAFEATINPFPED